MMMRKDGETTTNCRKKPDRQNYITTMIIKFRKSWLV